MNVGPDTKNRALVTQWLRRLDPEVVGIGEIAPRDTAFKAALGRLYPHSATCLGNTLCSTAVFWRGEGRARPLAHGDPDNRKALSALALQSDGTQIFVLHLSRMLPLGKQRHELAELSSYITDPADTLAIGDFNQPAATWTLRDFAAVNRLEPISTDRPTWPVHVAGLNLGGWWQIDHLLIGSRWRVLASGTSDDLGSDHRGIWFDVCAIN